MGNLGEELESQLENSYKGIIAVMAIKLKEQENIFEEVRELYNSLDFEGKVNLRYKSKKGLKEWLLQRFVWIENPQYKFFGNAYDFLLSQNFDLNDFFWGDNNIIPFESEVSKEVVRRIDIDIKNKTYNKRDK
jgi:hypothetical protein